MLMRKDKLVERIKHELAQIRMNIVYQKSLGRKRNQALVFHLLGQEYALLVVLGDFLEIPEYKAQLIEAYKKKPLRKNWK